jgi:hypothetical protein
MVLYAQDLVDWMEQAGREGREGWSVGGKKVISFAGFLKKVF